MVGLSGVCSKLWKLPYTLSEDQVGQIIDLVLSEKAQGALDAQQVSEDGPLWQCEEGDGAFGV